MTTELGAERKTRDEERRAAKRRMAATTRKKYEDLYHQPCERSEFYSMSDLLKQPVLFTPAEDLDKVSSVLLYGMVCIHVLYFNNLCIIIICLRYHKNKANA
ncbi:Grainyhead-like protein 2 [Halocaridina rubra]|uniref:Grainyhead-like protein 2 n=1 Tax=Halocaridina rubra TaxID=373956 RepID=A0AAN8XFJ0_HALRR